MARSRAHSWTLALTIAAVCVLTHLATECWLGPVSAQSPADRELFSAYKRACREARRGTYEERVLVCSSLSRNEQLVEKFVQDQRREVCQNIDRECSPSNKEGRERLSYFASVLQCPTGASACTRETTRTTALVDARAPGTIPALKQPTNMTCWATVATMMYSWKNNRRESIESALRTIGATYLDMFRRNQGMSGADKPGFLLTMGLKAEAPQNYTAEGWASLIRRHGPLWVTTNEGTQNRFSIHARVMSAIFGDSSANGTTVVLYDPADGQVHTETLGLFTRKFEDVARGDLGSTGDLRPQVVHY
jgi:hypothetical protein